MLPFAGRRSLQEVNLPIDRHRAIEAGEIYKKVNRNSKCLPVAELAKANM